jgi:hypothetical protein
MDSRRGKTWARKSSSTTTSLNGDINLRGCMTRTKTEFFYQKNLIREKREAFPEREGRGR